MRRLVWCVAVLAVAALPAPITAQERSGRIDGRIVRADGSPVSGVSVVVNDTSMTALSGSDGRFVFGRLPPATYSITITLGESLDTIADVRVVAGETTVVERTVDWAAGFTDSVVVRAASRTVERIIDAPGSITSVPLAEIEQRATHAQVPKLLEFSTGVQVTQSGIYDFNVNTRGFNSSLNRRVATLIDGRDPSTPFLGSQEWAAIPFPLDDLASMELLRGPSAALYGANASSGVLNMTTKAPRDSLGGSARATVGELGTANFDFRWAHDLGSGWYTKVVGATRRHDDFTVARVGAAEYTVPCAPRASGGCLPQEAAALGRASDRVLAGAARLDKYFANGLLLIMEGGTSDITGPVFQTGIGRIQVLDVQRPWARVDVTSDRFNVLASYSGRRANRNLALGSGGNIVDNSRRIQIEGQSNFKSSNGRVRVVVGGSAAAEHVDTFDDQVRRQTALFEPVSGNKQAAFGQVDWKITPSLTLVLASRADFSSLHEWQLSPKGSLVYGINDSHSVRFTYNEGFQVPNYSELSLQADSAPAANLGALNALCTPFNVDCGLQFARVLAVGNADLRVETNRTWEVGYKGMLGGRAFLTVDFYRSAASDFVTDLIPQLGTTLGRVNSQFGPWQAPAGVPDAVAETIRGLAPPILSNNLDGSPILVAASYTNFGDVDTQGVDVGVNYYFDEGWRASATYSWFDFQIAQNLPGFANLLLPNAPEHSVSLGALYEHRRFNVGVDGRWVDDFQWAVGPFQGPVESYATVDVNGNVNLPRGLTLGVQIANLFDNRHWESFGGDVLRRRALTSLTYRW